jgi:TolB-like protein/Flp pilus assembly protein TadD
LPEVRSIAVLPFVNMSTDAENEYFADGISEEILNLLADVKDLSVASRTSAFAFKGKDAPIPEIARQLDVRYVLEGSVRKAGGQVRVTAQLIDASTDRHLWSETYDRRLDDIFAIQDEIAGAIGDALQVELLGATGQRVASEAIDPDIYAMFLEARHLLRKRSAPDLRRANEMLIRVVEAEPAFARGHAVLGEAYLLNSGSAQQIVPDEIGNAQARMHAEIAKSLDPDLGGIYLIFGNLKTRQADLVGALAEFDRAIALEPAEPRPYHWRGMVFSITGHLDRARADLLEAVRLEPDNANASGWLSTIECALGNMDRAVELAMRQAALGNPAGFRQASHYQLQMGKIDAAADSLERAEVLDGGDPEFSRAVIAVARDPAALPQLERVIQEKRYGADDYDLRYSLIALRQFDLLGRLVEKELAAKDLGSLPTMVWADDYADFRRGELFTRWIDTLGVTTAWDALGPPPDCRRQGDGYACGFGFGGAAD